MIIGTSILFGHFIGDFLLQPGAWGDNKHKDTWEGSKALMKHVATYTATIALCLWLGLNLTNYVLSVNLVVWWALANGVLHTITDYFSSRAFHKFWPTHRRLAINIFGLDQLIHILCLFGTLGCFP